MDIKRFGRQLTRVILLLAASLFLASCSTVQESKNTPQAGSVFEVDPSLREFYKTLGGEALLGPAISKRFANNTLECQYTANALMCLDPARTGENRFGLYPLGSSLEVREDPPEKVDDSGGRVVNGYSIYEEFIDPFDRFSGIRYAGAPLSQVHINYAQQRYEQYFENIGFYRNLNDPPGTVKLVAYGTASCAAECTYAPPGESLLLGTSTGSYNQPFLQQLGQLGAETIFGEPLTQPYVASDGAREQVYANAVLYSPAGKEDQVLLRKLSGLLELDHSDPGPQVYGNQDGMVFYPVENDLGFHVPLVFDQFIAAHGGIRLSGKPISEVLEVETGLYRQCFENYCLDFQPGLPQNEQVNLVALGARYLENLQQSGSNPVPLVLSTETVNLTLTERSKTVPANSPQQITISLTSKETGQPIPEIEAFLDMILPGGETFHAEIPATDSAGESLVNIPAMNTVGNGTILTYTVCLKTVTEPQVCVPGSYLIWNSP